MYTNIGDFFVIFYEFENTDLQLWSLQTKPWIHPSLVLILSLWYLELEFQYVLLKAQVRDVSELKDFMLFKAGDSSESSGILLSRAIWICGIPRRAFECTGKYVVDTSLHAICKILKLEHLFPFNFRPYELPWPINWQKRLNCSTGKNHPWCVRSLIWLATGCQSSAPLSRRCCLKGWERRCNTNLSQTVLLSNP